jgi:hypothetical protein
MLPESWLSFKYKILQDTRAAIASLAHDDAAPTPLPHQRVNKTQYIQSLMHTAALE